MENVWPSVFPTIQDSCLSCNADPENSCPMSTGRLFHQSHQFSVFRTRKRCRLRTINSRSDHSFTCVSSFANLTLSFLCARIAFTNPFLTIALPFSNAVQLDLPQIVYLHRHTGAVLNQVSGAWRIRWDSTSRHSHPSGSSSSIHIRCSNSCKLNRALEVST